MQFVDNAGRTLTVMFGSPDMAATLTVAGPGGFQVVELDAKAYRALGLRFVDMAKIAGEMGRRASATGADAGPAQPGGPSLREQPSVIVQLKERPTRDDSDPLQELQSGGWGPMLPE